MAISTKEQTGKICLVPEELLEDELEEILEAEPEVSLAEPEARIITKHSPKNSRHFSKSHAIRAAMRNNGAKKHKIQAKKPDLDELLNLL
ncbi:hypothetical protein JXA32_07460 [Candidatus Sumerlaeota bacterium]|nr:hypothetical protein [Candidatus Sumerlaeota bacterium]